MALDIVCMGEPMLEFNQDPASTDPVLYRKGHGGDTANSAVAAARQGARVGYLTALGTDTFGDDFMALWEREGIDTSRVLRNPDAHTGIYFVTHGAKGHEFSYMRAGSAASRMKPEQVPADYVASAKFLHISGISQAISADACDSVFAAIDAARKAGTKVSYDTNLRLRLWPIERARAVMNATAAMADVLLPSLDDATALTGLEDADAIADFYLKLGAKLVAVKLGPQGSLVASPDWRERVPGRTVKAVDATGAGDTFAGSFLAELARGTEPRAAARYANAAAALSTQGFGAVAPIPRREAVEAFLAS